MEGPQYLWATCNLYGLILAIQRLTFLICSDCPHLMGRHSHVLVLLKVAQETVPTSAQQFLHGRQQPQGCWMGSPMLPGMKLLGSDSWSSTLRWRWTCAWGLFHRLNAPLLILPAGTSIHCLPLAQRRKLPVTSGGWRPCSWWWAVTTESH